MKSCTFISSAILFVTVLVASGSLSAQEPAEPDATADDTKAVESKTAEPDATADDTKAVESKSSEPDTTADDTRSAESKSAEPDATADDTKAVESKTAAETSLPGEAEAKQKDVDDKDVDGPVTEKSPDVASPKKTSSAAAVKKKSRKKHRGTATPSDAKAQGLALQELEVITDPEGAMVSLGGSSPEFQQALGRTPLRVPMAPGALKLVIELDGYKTATAELDVERGKPSVMQIRLEKETLRSRFAFRLAGHLLFWPGLVTAGTGIALIAVHESDDSKNTDVAGFVTAGIGVAMTAAGGIILGLTSRNRDPYVMPVSFMGTPDGRGGGVMYRRVF